MPLDQCTKPDLATDMRGEVNGDSILARERPYTKRLEPSSGDVSPTLPI